MSEKQFHITPTTEPLIIREGAALPLREPQIVAISGVIDTPLLWLKKRVETIDQLHAHVVVSRDEMGVKLVVDESDFYKTTIVGKLELSKIFVDFGINSGRYKTPLELSEFIKMNRAYFDNREVAMNLVSVLRNFRAKIDKQVETEVDLNKGDRNLTRRMAVDSNVPKSFVLKIPVFKGSKPVELEIETYFNPDDLTCSLVSPQANEIMIDTRDMLIQNVIDGIADIAPRIAILEV